MEDSSAVRMWFDILEETERQDAKWGSQRDLSRVDWMPILTEEVGEVAKSINDNETIDDLRNELVQVAAVCLQWIDNLDRAKDIDVD